MFERLFKKNKETKTNTRTNTRTKQKTYKISPLETGAKIFQLNTRGIPSNEKIIIETVGKGKLLEEEGLYKDAILCYEKAEQLTLTICAEEIAELKRDFPDRPDDWDWLYLKMIRRRIRVCLKALKKNK